MKCHTLAGLRQQHSLTVLEPGVGNEGVSSAVLPLKAPEEDPPGLFPPLVVPGTPWPPHSSSLSLSLPMAFPRLCVFSGYQIQGPLSPV